MMMRRLPRILAWASGVLLARLCFIAFALAQCDTRWTAVTMKQTMLITQTIIIGM